MAAKKTTTEPKATKKSKTPKPKKERGMSALDAAAKVLGESKGPMASMQMIAQTPRMTSVGAFSRWWRGRSEGRLLRDVGQRGRTRATAPCL
jgi:hypothetical protein